MKNGCNRVLDNPDIGKLILRVSFAVLMLFHGWHKVLSGISYIQGLLAAQGLPEFIGYGVYVGEVIAPVLMILGILTRPSALVFAFTMIVATLMVKMDSLLMVDPKTGAWALESVGVYFAAGLSIAFLGSGRYSVTKNPNWQ